MTYNCTNISIKKGKQSSVTITAEVPAETMLVHRAKAIAELSKNIKIDGFRAGHIPEKVLEERVGEAAIMQEAAEHAISEQYPQLIEKEKLQLIGRPNVSVSKLNKDEAMTFTIEATLLPEVTLPDYSAIAKKHTENQTELTITDEEVTETLNHLRKERAKIEHIEAGASPEEATKKAAEMDISALPQVDDTFVKTLGYDSADVFKEKLRENILNEKTNKEREKTRITMIEEIIKETKLEIPDTLIDAELGNMESQFAHDLSHNGMTLEKYLSETKKTKEDLHKEWRVGAEKRAAMQLITREIGQKENIAPSKEQIDSEVSHIISHTKEADPESVRAYVTSSLRTELVFRFLEDQKSAK